MRLNCANCGAEYEIEDEAIPSAGREVQCSACGHVWFAGHQPDLPLEPALRAAPATQEPPPLPRRPVDPAALAILREEAEREMSARAARAGPGEAQGNLGLDAAVTRAAGARTPATPKAPVGTAPAVLAPDVIPPETMAPTAKTAPAPAAAEAPKAVATPPTPMPEPAGSGGFLRGFVLALVLGGVLAALYLKADDIAQEVPAAAPYLSGYADAVDALRLRLGDLAQAIRAAF